MPASQASTAQGERRRARIVAFVADYWTTYGYAPSLREVAAGSGLSAWSTAVYEVNILVAEGRLARTPRIPRSIRVVER